MLLLLRGDFTFKVKGKIRAYVKNETLKIDSRYVYWEKMMNKLAYKLRKTTFCPYCHNKVNKNKIILDSIFPISYGGISISNNLLPCCENCHSMKGSLDGSEFWESRQINTDEERNNFIKEVIQKKEQNRYIKGFNLPKDWVEYCDINDLKVRKFYQKNYTESNKLRENKEYIEKYGHLKRPIIVDKNYWILDGYNCYLAAKQKQIDTVPVIILENVELFKL